MAVYAMSLPIISALVVSILALLVTSPLSISVYLIFLVLFVMETLIFKPLVSYENRNERKKVGTYLIVTMSIIQIINLGIIRSIIFAIIMYGMYKIVVNGLSVAFNNQRKIVFSNEEIIGLILTIIISIVFNYSMVKNINLLGLNIQNIYILILAIITSIVVPKRGAVIGITTLGVRIYINEKYCAFRYV